VASGGVNPGGQGDGYAGDVQVDEAWGILSSQNDAVLVDVRTPPEWAFVGVPDLASLGKETVFVPWQLFPSMEQNANFAEELARQGVTAEKTVLFLCRSGQRSKSAAIAMTAHGYQQCFNVAGGFEGPLDGARHRGSVDGWKARDLPWVQQ